MGLLGKLFGKKKEKEKKQSMDMSVGISFDENHNVSISSSDVGVSTGSTAKDFYVYAWFIKETGETFYVGKGRKDRYKEFHERAYEAEKIRNMYDTGVRFVGEGLTEDEAIALETQEMTRILNETNDRLTNRIIPLLTNRDNGYDRSPGTPALQFEKAPCLYPSEIEEHYFGIKHRSFDGVVYENLKNVVFIDRNMRDEIDVIYGGNLDKYISETKTLLLSNKSKIMKSKYAKSITAWIYIGDDYVTNYESDQDQALEKLGRNIPTYHLIDVWLLLKEKYGEVEVAVTEELSINPVHNRVALNKIKNSNDSHKGFAEGMPYWEKGDRERKDGNIERAIELFDKARYNGYDAPVLYDSYAMAYRKLKDYDNEIAILDEAIDRLNIDGAKLIKFKERREKALALKAKK
ncbi:GIY-YIG nuclease family protein [Evansella clarkii]|uniref:GIY-YIG nuclease family protein n=1 Tax=Evansella clarkii TaxID=79879 RepID=UPI00111675D2|nr:GIY-YIG nuclease family protein [Evansella clarkii]